MILGKPNTKCPHGVFLAGEAKAKYCSFCNPDLTLARNQGVEEIEIDDDTVQTASFEADSVAA